MMDKLKYSKWEDFFILEGLPNDKKKIVEKNLDALCSFLYLAKFQKLDTIDNDFQLFEIISFPLIRLLFSSVNEEDINDFSFENLYTFYKENITTYLKQFVDDCVDHFTKK